MFKAVGAAYRVTEPLASGPLPIDVIKGSRFGAALGAPELLTGETWGGSLVGSGEKASKYPICIFPLTLYAYPVEKVGGRWELSGPILPPPK